MLMLRCSKGKEGFRYWLYNYCKTLDSHDLESPVKCFPQKEYIDKLIDNIISSPGSGHFSEIGQKAPGGTKNC